MATRGSTDFRPAPFLDPVLHPKSANNIVADRAVRDISQEFAKSEDLRIYLNLLLASGRVFWTDRLGPIGLRVEDTECVCNLCLRLV